MPTSLSGQDLLTELDALIADVYTWASDELLDLVGLLPTEAALQLGHREHVSAACAVEGLALDYVAVNQVPQRNHHRERSARVFPREARVYCGTDPDTTLTAEIAAVGGHFEAVRRVSVDVPTWDLRRPSASPSRKRHCPICFVAAAGRHGPELPYACAPREERKPPAARAKKRRGPTR